jgi:hypothetical protein
MPDYPAAWVKAIRDLGSTGAIIALCGYMVFRLMSGVPTAQDMTDVKGMLGAHITTTNSELGTIRALLQSICYNTATTENQRASCGASAGR